LHQDVAAGGDGWPLIGFIFMIDEFSEQNGATRFVPGTANLDSMEEALRRAHPDEERACGPPGSMVIFHGSIWHGFGANLSACPRRGVYGALIPQDAKPARDFSATLAPTIWDQLSAESRELLSAAWGGCIERSRGGADALLGPEMTANTLEQQPASLRRALAVIQRAAIKNYVVPDDGPRRELGPAQIQPFAVVAAAHIPEMCLDAGSGPDLALRDFILRVKPLHDPGSRIALAEGRITRNDGPLIRRLAVPRGVKCACKIGRMNLFAQRRI
jgi:hypothetical protein